MNKITRTVTIAAIGALGALGLVGCGSDTKTTPAGTVTPATNATGSTMTDESMAPGSTEAMTDDTEAMTATTTGG